MGSAPHFASSAPPGARRFVYGLMASILTTLGCVAVVNLLVDPHGFYRWVDQPGFNEIKPRGDQAIELFKYRAVDFVQPGTLYMGNSRSELGWDPQAAGSRLPLPGVNVSLPGRGLGTMNQLADYAWSRSRPKVLVVGVEFFDCLAAGKSVEYAPAPLHPWATDRPPLRSFADQAYLMLSDLLSLDTAMDSALTVVAQWRRASPHLRRDGFRTAHDYDQMVVVDGARKMFLQREQETVRGRVAGPKSIRYEDGKLDGCFRELEVLLQNGVRRDQTIHVSTYPYHARLLEIIGEVGLWPAYEDWKREVLRIVTAARADGGRVTLRDFGSYHGYAVEPIPMGDRRFPVPRWYWESGHFKADLGTRMVDIIVGNAPPEGLFGVELTPETIDATLMAIRQSRERYADLQPAAVAEIRDFVSRAQAAVKARP